MCPAVRLAAMRFEEQPDTFVVSMDAAVVCGCHTVRIYFSLVTHMFFQASLTYFCRRLYYINYVLKRNHGALDRISEV